MRTLPLTGLGGRGVPFASWWSSNSSGWIKLARSTVSPPPVEAWEGLRRVRGPVVAGASGGEQGRALACELRSDYWTSGAVKAVLVEQLSSIRMSQNFAQHHQVFCTYEFKSVFWLFFKLKRIMMMPILCLQCPQCHSCHNVPSIIMPIPQFRPNLQPREMAPPWQVIAQKQVLKHDF